MVDLFSNAVTKLDDIKNNPADAVVRNSKVYCEGLRRRFIATADKNLKVMTGDLDPSKGMSYMYNNGRLVPKLGRSPIVIWDAKGKNSVFGWDLSSEDAIKMLKLLIKTVKAGELDYALVMSEFVSKIRLDKKMPKEARQDVFEILYEAGYGTGEENAKELNSYAEKLIIDKYAKELKLITDKKRKVR